MQLDLEHFADVVALAIKTAQAPLLARIVSLEQRAAVMPSNGKDGEPGPPGPPGKDVESAVVHELKADIAALQFDRLETKAALEPDVLAELVKAEVAKAVAALPPPRDGQPGEPGKSVDVEELRGLVAAEVVPVVRTELASAVASLPTPKDGAPGVPGKSVESAEVKALVQAEVATVLGEWPKPQNGTSVTVADVQPLLEELVTKAVDALPKPQDGVGVRDAFVDRDGHLVQTYTDGRTKDVGIVVGRDVDMAFVSQRIAEEVAKAVEALPKPKDGRDGSLEQLKMAQVDEETAQFVRADGTPVEGGTVKLSGFFDKGVWREGETYRKGYAVSFGGSLFIAQRDTTSKPETDDSWRLAVKRGRDGRNAKDVSAPAGPVRLHG